MNLRTAGIDFKAMLVEYTLLEIVYEVIYNFSLATPTIWVESSHANNSKRENLNSQHLKDQGLTLQQLMLLK